MFVMKREMSFDKLLPGVDIKVIGKDNSKCSKTDDKMCMRLYENRKQYEKVKSITKYFGKMIYRSKSRKGIEKQNGNQLNKWIREN